MSGRASRNKALHSGYNKVTFLKGNLWKRFGLQFCHASIVTRTGTRSQTLGVSEHHRLHASREAGLGEYLVTRTMTGATHRFFFTKAIASTQSKFIDWLQKLSLALDQRGHKSITLMAIRQTTELTTLSGSAIRKTAGTLTGLLMAGLPWNTKAKECPWPKPALNTQSMVFELKTHAEG